MSDWELRRHSPNMLPITFRKCVILIIRECLSLFQPEMQAMNVVVNYLLNLTIKMNQEKGTKVLRITLVSYVLGRLHYAWLGLIAKVQILGSKNLNIG